MTWFFLVNSQTFQLFMRLPKSLWRIFKYYQWTLSANSYRRVQLWSSWRQFLVIKINFSHENDFHSNHCVIIWHLGSNWSGYTTVVPMVYGKQNLCLHDGFLCWQYAWSSGMSPTISTIGLELNLISFDFNRPIYE